MEPPQLVKDLLHWEELRATPWGKSITDNWYVNLLDQHTLSWTLIQKCYRLEMHAMSSNRLSTCAMTSLSTFVILMMKTGVLTELCRINIGLMVFFLLMAGTRFMASYVSPLTSHMTM